MRSGRKETRAGRNEMRGGRNETRGGRKETRGGRKETRGGRKEKDTPLSTPSESTLRIQTSANLIDRKYILKYQRIGEQMIMTP